MNQKKRIIACLCLIIISISILPRLLFPGNLPEKESSPSKEEENKGSFIFLPILFYTTETKIAAGIGGMYFTTSPRLKKFTRPSSISTDLIYTQKKQFIMELKPDLYLKNDKYHLMGYLSFRRFPDIFFGIGNNTSKEMEELYTFQSLKLTLSLKKQIRPNLFMGAEYEFDHRKTVKTEEGGQLAAGEIKGSKKGNVSGVGLSISWDKRDNIIYPTKGSLLKISSILYEKSLGSDYSFTQFSLDFRQYSTLFSSHVLASQGYISIITGDPPFFKMSMLGGQNLFRGYYEGRYRDKNLLVFQSEYRMPLIWNFGIAVFAGFGDVADKISGFKFQNFKYSIGFGIRYQVSKEEKVNIRLDFGFGKNSTGFYITLNEAF